MTLMYRPSVLVPRLPCRRLNFSLTESKRNILTGSQFTATARNGQRSAHWGARSCVEGVRLRRWHTSTGSAEEVMFSPFIVSAGVMGRRYLSMTLNRLQSHNEARAAEAADANGKRPSSFSAVSSTLSNSHEVVEPGAAPPSTASSHSVVQAEIEAKLLQLRQEFLEPYDTVYHFLAPLKSTMPMLMLLGNHSSGKSTLINYLSGREIQETGVAPTDDGFTVIKRGTFDMNADGPTVVSNPNHQFQSLQKFGLPFVTHFRMKVREMPSSSHVPLDMVLVDTPGMIDTPVHTSSSTRQGGSDHFSEDDGNRTRGYDFLAVTRWFAQQSDVILLMFDPANPGTTGETLDVLTKSLSGYEHKFFVVMNKADVFEKVTDFARAYGTLCWNLSKVIKMKDIPRIYTTCTPLQFVKDGSTVPSSPNGKAGTTVPEAELSRQRNELINEIRSAPTRRMDNLITETEESVRTLLLACRAARLMRQDYRKREMMLYSVLGTCWLLGPAAVAALVTLGAPGMIWLALTSIAFGCSGIVTIRRLMQEFERKLLASDNAILKRICGIHAPTKDMETRWVRAVLPELLRVTVAAQEMGQSGILRLPTCSMRACRRMQHIIDEDIPALRRMVTEYKEGFFRGRK